MSLARITRLITRKIKFSSYNHERTLHLFPSEFKYKSDQSTANSFHVQRCNPILTRNVVLLQKLCKRHKYNKNKSNESDDEDSDADEDTDPFTKVFTTHVPSMRTDVIVKMGLGLARNKVEIAFYESRIRLNGRKVLKKSAPVVIGDVIDLIVGPSPKNPNFLIVQRITILSASAKEELIRLKYTKDKSLLIENYEDEWEPVNVS